MQTSDLFAHDDRPCETAQLLRAAALFIAGCAVALAGVFTIFQGTTWVGAIALLLSVNLIALAAARWTRARVGKMAMLAPFLAGAWMPALAYVEGNSGLVWCYPVMALGVLLAPINLAPALLVWGVISVFAACAARASLLEGAGACVTLVAVGAVALLMRLAQERRLAWADDNAAKLKRTLEAAQIRYLVWDRSLGIRSISPALAQMLKFGASEPLPTDVEELVHPDDRHRLKIAMPARVLKGSDQPQLLCECRLIARSGKTSWVRVRALASLQPGRDRWLLVFQPIDDRVKAENALRDAHRKIRSQAAELAQQQEALREALYAREEVERLARHDLKGPLKSIAAVPALMRQRGGGLPEEHGKLLAMIERTANRALGIVNLSMDLYRMEEGTYRFEPKANDLGGIVRTCVAELALHAKSKSVELNFVNGEHASSYAACDALLTTSIVENLLRNAIEAAPEHSVVTLAIYQGVRIGVIIHNSGVVHPSVRDNFFDKYTTHGKSSGTGLGTYSALLAARAQGGDLTMATSSVNGTTLTLKLRRATEVIPGGPDEALTMPGDLIDLDAVRSQEARQLEVLVVDDDDHNWLILREWMPSHVRAHRAVNGRAAIDAIVDMRPDLIIMDLEMPVMGGFEALQKIRYMQGSAGEHPSHIVAFTAHDDDKTIERIGKEGFDGILAKPVVMDSFNALLASLEGPEDMADRVWVDQDFVDQFPSFIESRRSLADQACQALEAGDIGTAAKAAHTLAGSPALHGFERAVAACRVISRAYEGADLNLLRREAANVRAMLMTLEVRATN